MYHDGHPKTLGLKSIHNLFGVDWLKNHKSFHSEQYKMYNPCIPDSLTLQHCTILHVSIMKSSWLCNEYMYIYNIPCTSQREECFDDRRKESVLY